MKKCVSILCAVVFLLPIWSIAAAGEPAPVDVLELKTATGVENRNPVGESDTFEVGTNVFVWLKLRVRKADATVKVRYSMNNVPAWTSGPINLGMSTGWKTWVRRGCHTAGTWTVNVLDAQDKSIYEAQFTVQ